MKKLITILFALVCIFSFSAVNIFAENDETYSDGRLVQGNDIRYISAKMMQYRFIKKTEFMDDKKYENILKGKVTSCDMMRNMYLKQTSNLVEYFPENYDTVSDYEKFVFYWTYADSCSTLKAFGGQADYDSCVRANISSLLLYFPNDEEENAAIYQEAVTEALTWQYNNWLMETTVHNPYTEEDEETTEATTEETTENAVSETTKNGDSAENATGTTTAPDISTAGQKTFWQKYWFSFTMIGVVMLVFVVYRIVKAVKNK